MAGTVANERALLGALQPLVGPPATGKLTIQSVGPTGTVPAFSYLVPVVSGCLLTEAAVFVRKQSEATSDWVVTSAGTLVDVESLTGGAIGNLPSGTTYRFVPEIEGIAELAVASGPIAGGVTDGPLRHVTAFKRITGGTIEELVRSGSWAYPAAVLSWEATQSRSSSLDAAKGPRNQRADDGQIFFRHNWGIYLFTSRLESEGARRDEAAGIRDMVISALSEHTYSRGMRLSTNPGVEIMGARPLAATPTAYVDVVQISTQYPQPKGIVGNPSSWSKIRLVAETDIQAGSRIILADTTIPRV